MLAGKQRERHRAAGTDDQPAFTIQPHMAVTAQARRVNVHRLDHRPPAADAGAPGVEDRPAVPQGRDIGGRASHIDRPDVALGGPNAVPLDEMPGAHRAGGRPGKDRLDGPLHRPLRAHQRTVTPNDHQRRGDAQAGQRLLDVRHQFAQREDEMGVERDGGRPPHGVELAGQLVAARHRLAGQFLDEAAHPQLMRRIAHAEVTRNGKRFHGLAAGQDRRPGRFLVQGRDFIPQPVVTAFQVHDIGGGEIVFEPPLLDQFGIVADEQQTDRAAVSFSQRVGRQRRRKSDKRHIFRRKGGSLSLGDGKHRADRAADADRQIMARRQRLGARQHGARLVVHQNGIGVGAAGINAKRKLHEPGLPVVGMPPIVPPLRHYGHATA